MHSRVVVWLVAAIAASMMLPNGTGAVQAAGNPAVLFEGDMFECEFQVAGRLNEDGFNLAQGVRGRIEQEAMPWEVINNYNALVLSGLGRANADMTLTAQTQATLATLNKYLQDGGGVLIFPLFGQVITVKGPQDAFLKPLGLTPLFEEQAFDSNPTIATSWKLPFGHTTDITPSPITAGVSSLWYPVPTYRVGAQHHNIPFAVDKTWTVVVRGAPTSYTKSGPLQADPPTAAGTYASSVPLVAYKQVGKGRIVYIGITPEYFIGRYATNTLESIVLDTGLQGQPSNGFKLFENALKWLAEPSVQAGNLGGAAMDPSLLTDPYKVQYGAPYAWPAKIQFPAAEPAWPGVIGARSTYSSGTASVDQWVAEAKRQKLSFLVFLEEFSKLSPANFDKLKADCKRLSDKSFEAIPGFTIDDMIGNHYFYFGDTFPYPKPQHLDPTGKFFATKPLNPDGVAGPGILAGLTLDYAYSLSSFRLTAGNYNFNQSQAPFPVWFSDWDATSVVTSVNGKVSEDFTQGFLKLVDYGDAPVPLALNLMDSPAQLATAKWKTVVRSPEAGKAVIGGILNPDRKIRDLFNVWTFYPPNPTAIYVSSGPAIESWSMVGSRDYEGNNKGDFVWQNYRWALRGQVHSDVGLQEVAIYDGTDLYRRFLPGGAKDYEVLLDINHDQQHSLVLIATDAQGNRAVSEEQFDRNHRLEEFMCGDRNNQLTYGYVIASDGRGILLGGNQGLATSYKRIPQGISPSGTFKNDQLLGAPAFDGATGGEPTIWEASIMNKDGKEVPAPIVTEAARLMANGDVNIGEGMRAWNFTDNIPVTNCWGTLWKTQPATDFTVNRRVTFFNIDPDSPLAVFLWRTDIKLLRDLPNDGFTVLTMGPAEAKTWAVRTSDGQALVGNWEDTPRSTPRWLNQPFGLNSYAAALDSPLGGAAIFPLTDGQIMNWGLPGRTRMAAMLSKDSSPQRAGDTARVETLLVGIPRTTEYTKQFPAVTTEVVEKFFHDFGLDGGPTGYTVAPQSGKITGQRYILDVDSAGSGCFSGQLTGKLISSLPIRLSGLNNHWSCYLYDRTLKQARPLGVLENQAYAMLLMRGKLDVFVGEPLLADNPDVHLQLTQVGDNAWKAEIHNPTDKVIHVTVKKNPFFDPLQGKPFTQETLDLPAGSSVLRDL